MIEEKVRNEGVFYKKKWLNTITVKKLKKILSSSEAYEKTNRKGVFSTTKKQLIKDLFKFEFNRFRYSIYLLQLSKKLKLEKIANEIFNEQSQLKVIDSYISRISIDPIIEWHQDQAFSGRENVKEKELKHPDNGFVKFFFFLTEVDLNNGSLAYIPNSNTISVAYKKALYNKEIIYKPFWKLKDFRQQLKENKDKILKYVSEKTLKEFLDNSNFIEKKSDTDVYDKSLMPGDAIIFDEHGVHRGSKPSYNDRYIVRFCFQRKRFDN
jgi:hypothetical protein